MSPLTVDRRWRWGTHGLSRSPFPAGRLRTCPLLLSNLPVVSQSCSPFLLLSLVNPCPPRSREPQGDAGRAQHPEASTRSTSAMLPRGPGSRERGGLGFAGPQVPSRGCRLELPSSQELACPVSPRSGRLGVSAGMLGCSERPGPDSPGPGS